ncbi:hypothetical protein FRB96_009418 [Tulasnella sp. 330]|nr:hypothetical protein FRB96_009418 [Tulasnella sp. 330]
MATVPPQKYVFERSNTGGFACKHINIIQLSQTATLELEAPSSLVSPPSPTSTLVSPSFKAVSTDEKTLSKTVVKGSIVYHIRHLKWYSKSYELIRGAPDGETGNREAGEKSEYGVGNEAGGRVMDIQQEGCNRPSTYTYVASTGTNADDPVSIVMNRRKGPGGEPWWSRNRSFDDIDGVHYKIETTFYCDFKITRTVDGVVVARFVRTKFSWRELGKLTIFIPVSPALLHLLLSTTHMKHLQDKKRGRDGGG